MALVPGVRVSQGARVASLPRLARRPRCCRCIAGRSWIYPAAGLPPPPTGLISSPARSLSTRQARTGARPDPALDTALLQSWLAAVDSRDVRALLQLVPALQRELRSLRFQQADDPAARPSARYRLAIRDALNCTLEASDCSKRTGSSAWTALLALFLARIGGPHQSLSPPLARRTLSMLLGAAVELGSGSLGLTSAALTFLEEHDTLAGNPSCWVDVVAASVSRGDLQFAQSVLEKAKVCFAVPNGSYGRIGLFPLAVLQDTVNEQLGMPSDELTCLLDRLDLASITTDCLVQGLRFLSLSKLRSKVGEYLHSELCKRTDHNEMHLAHLVFRAARLSCKAYERMEMLLSLVPAALRKRGVSTDLFTQLFLLSTFDVIRELRNYDQALALIYQAEHAFGSSAPAKVWEACIEGLLDRQPYVWWRPPNAHLVSVSVSAAPSRVFALSPLRVMEAGLLLDQHESLDGGLPASGWTRVLETYANQLVPDHDAMVRTWDHILAAYPGSLALHGGGGCYEVMLPLVREREGMRGVLRLLQTAAERQDLLSVSQLGSPAQYVELANTEAELLEFHHLLILLLARGLLGPEPEGWHVTYLWAVVERRFPQYSHRRKLQHPGLAVSGDGLLVVCRGLRRIGRAPNGVDFVKLLNKVKRASSRESDTRRPQARDEAMARVAREQAAEQVAALHTAMQEDAEVEPDIRLLNTLMNAYNFVGDAEAAVGIWFSLLQDRRAITSSTLSILFDLCGWAFFPNTATRAWDWAREVDRDKDEASRPKRRLPSPRLAPAVADAATRAAVPRLRPGQAGAPEDAADSREWMAQDTARLVNDHVKLSYLEMLCRCYLLRPAYDLAWTLVETGEMEGKRGVEREMWTLLLKFFARKRDRVGDPIEQRALYDALRKRIRTERSHVWDKSLARVGTDIRPMNLSRRSGDGSDQV